jgi:plastocyanin
MRAFSLIALVFAFAIPVAGCGGDDDSSSSSNSSSGGSSSATTNTTSSSTSGGGGGQTLKIAADPNGALKFDKTSLSAKAGKVSIVMTNTSSIPHAVELEGGGIEKKGAVVTGGGSVSKVTAALKPGTYEFYCPVDGHKAAGMKGTLTVS